jgi:predicted nucleic acid-binding protein
MSDPRTLYWDASCFICFLNKDEAERRVICEDVLRHAQSGTIEIWTSTWTIVEVIRPRRQGSKPLPPWAVEAIKAIEKSFPDAQRELEQLWRRYQAFDPSKKLTVTQIAKIQGMFEWPFVKKINLDQRVANKAVELARDCGLKPADSVHAASAILKKVDALQRWDRDFDKVKYLIAVEEPQRISDPSLWDLLPVGPNPEDFQDSKQEPSKTTDTGTSATQVQERSSEPTTKETAEGEVPEAEESEK